MGNSKENTNLEGSTNYKGKMPKIKGAVTQARHSACKHPLLKSSQLLLGFLIILLMYFLLRFAFYVTIQMDQVRYETHIQNSTSYHPHEKPIKSLHIQIFYSNLCLNT